MKFAIASLSVFLSLLVSPLSAAEGYEQRVKHIAKRLPQALKNSETVNDWWPLDKGIEYRYRVVGGRWPHNKKATGTVFTVQVSRDDANLYRFKVDGFSEFPYRGLKVKKNRVFLLETRASADSPPTTSTYERPFLAFPLFDGLMFHGLEKENEFLRETIMKTTDDVYWGPVNNGMNHVQATQEPDLYKISQATHAPLNHSFKRGVGPVRWSIVGGWTLELVSHSLQEGK